MFEKVKDVERIILHSDANCFYASVEMLYHPEYAGCPMAVGGDPEARHGIISSREILADNFSFKVGIKANDAGKL